MGIRYGLTMMVGSVSATELYCNHCGEHLGTEMWIGNNKEQSEFDNWNYCPYCAAPLY